MEHAACSDVSSQAHEARLLFLQETFRAQVQAVMEAKGLLQPGVVCSTPGERNKRAQEFVKNDVE